VKYRFLLLRQITQPPGVVVHEKKFPGRMNAAVRHAGEGFVTFETTGKPGQLFQSAGNEDVVDESVISALRALV
jgi:hypothetical protein